MGSSSLLSSRLELRDSHCVNKVNHAGEQKESDLVTKMSRDSKLEEVLGD